MYSIICAVLPLTTNSEFTEANYNRSRKTFLHIDVDKILIEADLLRASLFQVLKLSTVVIFL